MIPMDNITSHPSDAYDTEISKVIPYYSAIHDEIINLIKSLPIIPSLWLDTGCGTGNFVNHAMKIFPKTHFYLADPSEKMLELAARKVKGDNITFFTPTGTEGLQQHSSNSFDVITAIQCHHYLSKEKRFQAVSSCYSLLADNGIFVTSENIRPQTPEGIEIGLRYWHDFQERQGRTETDIQNHLMRFDREYFPLTIREHLELYRAAGFRVTEVLWVSYLQAAFYCKV